MNAISDFIWSSYKAAGNQNQQACLSERHSEQTEQMFSHQLQDSIWHLCSLTHQAHEQQPTGMRKSFKSKREG